MIKLLQKYLIYLMAERMGFEPMKELLLYTLSKRAPSTTRPPLHLCIFKFRWDYIIKDLNPSFDFNNNQIQPKTLIWNFNIIYADNIFFIFLITSKEFGGKTSFLVWWPAVLFGSPIISILQLVIIFIFDAKIDGRPSV